MIYLSADYIINAIKQLSPVHPFLGITFLTCKRNNLPIETTTDFAMDNKTKSFMDEVHKICPSSQYYFQPYTTVKGKYWLAAKYPSAGLQAINTQTFSDAFIHDRNSKQWGWANDYVRKIKSIGIGKNDTKRIPLAAIAIWIFKYRKWKDTTSIEDVVGKFIKEYHVTKDELSALFVDNADFPSVPAFQNSPVSWNQLSSYINSPPDEMPDQEGALAKLELVNVGPCDHVDMDLSSRLNIITGDNGLGKTFLMDCAWWALTNTWTGNPARPKYVEGRKKVAIRYSIAGKSKATEIQEALYDNKHFAWKRTQKSETVPGLIIYALVDGSYAVWDPSKMSRDVAVANVFTRQQVWDGESKSIEGLIRDWVKWQNTPDKYPFEVFKSVLHTMSPPDIGILEPGESVRIPNDSREIPTIVYPYGIVPVTNSSAGVGRILTLSYLIVWAWNEHKENCKLQGIEPDSRIVVMVDELEAHLHPKWQRTILPALIGIQQILADELEVQFIIATHSPLIMASVEPFFDNDIDTLFQIKLSSDHANAVLSKEDFVKYGQVNSWLTSPIFNMGQARSTNAEAAINMAKDLQLDDDPSAEDVQRVHEKLLQCLSQTDPFWPRWIFFAEQHGVKV